MVRMFLLFGSCYTYLLFATFVCLQSSVLSEKYKICIVDGRGGYKKAGRFCPILDGPDSKVECILGLDRLDCLRKISKGKADFSVFTAEDLVTARNSEIEILITNEMKYTNDTFEYEVVAVVNDDSGIQSRDDLRNKRLCHPGYGYEADWTKILANYLEASVVPQSCDPSLTLTENRIKASSEFFDSACKAGPWVDDTALDRRLKNKYSNLCNSCDVPGDCSKDDKYWGRRGPLLCLTDGAGDITWSRLDDVQIHFGLTPGVSSASPDGYSYLCPDGSKRPVNTTKPCVWVAKPWPVVATKRTSAQEIQRFISMLSYADGNSWQAALLALIETYYLSINTLNPIQSIESYLDRATGFLSANSFSGCHPPRTIKICTTSIIENAKCSWLRESATAYGIEPDLECLKADNTTHCMQALSDKVADITMVPPDFVHLALSEYNLKTLFYETVYDNDKYFTLAVVRKQSRIETFEDLEGANACFPKFDGVAWNSVIDTLHNKSLLNKCPYELAMEDFFGPSCVPDLPKNRKSKLNEICDGNRYSGEYGSLRCLMYGKGDVAFVSRSSLLRFLNDTTENPNKYTLKDLKLLCTSKTSSCHLSWAPAGYGMVLANRSELWNKDTLDVFLRLDNLFGRSYPDLTPPFSLYGKFDGQSNLLFHDKTVKLRQFPTVKNTDKMDKDYNSIIESIKLCSSLAYINTISYTLMISCSLVSIKLVNFVLHTS